MSRSSKTSKPARNKLVRRNVRKIIEKYGGHDAWIEATQKRIDEFDKVWIQDTDGIGRVLRAHLAVEHFVGEYIAFKNPSLGSLEKARLSYAQKLDLLDPKDRIVEIMLPGLRLLGAIRNRISHRLRVELSKTDEEAFLAVAHFRAMRVEMHKRWPKKPNQNEIESALTVLEEFAKWSAGLLHSCLDPQAHIWREVLGGPTNC